MAYAVQWYNYNWGYRMSRANTLGQVDWNELQREFAAKQIRCEVPQCGGLAVTVLRRPSAFYVCRGCHSEILADNGLGKTMLKSIISEKTLWLEQIKNEYFNKIHGFDQTVIQKVPGVSILETMRDDSADIEALVVEITLPPTLDDLPFPF